MKTPKLFISLSAMVALILILLIAVFTLWQQSPSYQPAIIGKLLLLGILAFTAVFFGIFLFILAGMSPVKIPYFLLKPLHSSINIVYPLLRTAGKLFRIDKERIQGAYIEVHNLVTQNALKKVFKPHETLILLPHCLQPGTCASKITENISQCQECGVCTIAKAKKLSLQGYKVKVVPGGTVARLEIKKERPQFIVAVACEHDLSQGIMGVGQCPVLGVVNQRPNGPCRDTTFEFEELENLLKEYCCDPQV